MHMFVKVHCKRPINGPGWTCGHHHYCSQMTSMMPASKLVSVLSKTGRTPPACPRVSAWAWGPELSTGCKSAGRLHSCCLAWNRSRLGRHWNGEKFRSRYEVWNLCWDTWWTSLRLSLLRTLPDVWWSLHCTSFQMISRKSAMTLQLKMIKPCVFTGSYTSHFMAY